MAIVHIALPIRQAMAEAVLAILEAEASTGPVTLDYYTGDIPATPLTAVTDQVLVGTVTCSLPSAEAVAGEVVFYDFTQDPAANAGGTITWVRLRDGAGAARFDFDVTNRAGDGAIKINTTTVVAGGPIAMLPDEGESSALVITMPGG